MPVLALTCLLCAVVTARLFGNYVFEHNFLLETHLFHVRFDWISQIVAATLCFLALTIDAFWLGWQYLEIYAYTICMMYILFASVITSRINKFYVDMICAVFTVLFAIKNWC